MNLQNGYKVIYEKIADDKRNFYASMSGIFADAEQIAEVTMGEYKLIYEKAGKIYGSKSGVPTENDDCFKAFDKVFCAHVDEDENNECDTCEEEIPVQPKRSRKTTPAVEEPVVEETPTVEE
jgi:hypothetical protein